MYIYINYYYYLLLLYFISSPFDTMEIDMPVEMRGILEGNAFPVAGFDVVAVQYRSFGRSKSLSAQHARSSWWFARPEPLPTIVLEYFG